MSNDEPRSKLTVARYSPSQADVVTFKAISTPPTVEKHPHAYRWYNHVKSYEAEFSSLPGDPSKPFTTYGPEVSQVTINPKDAPNDEEEEVDLFGSDEDEEEDPEVVKEREKRLADYNAKKALKTKPAAKSIVTMDVKPWDDETDLEKLKANVLAIEMDGLVWGGSKFVPVGFGIKKLQINVVIEVSQLFKLPARSGPSACFSDLPFLTSLSGRQGLT